MDHSTAKCPSTVGTGHNKPNAKQSLKNKNRYFAANNLPVLQKIMSTALNNDNSYTQFTVNLITIE